MTTNILSSARVPDYMYVERDADAQILHIIQEMSRPGYVLVARQMGKTNLLLHTKERYQSEREIYVYVDFSTMNGYSEDDCLKSLIDIAIEVNWNIFEEAESLIEELRSKPSYKAIKMFTRELRILLKYVDKIVFILDEIDALTRQPYSDRIFSLIRGHYFATTNFPELRKATFILSGVIEPKDIIKDPNISPFNIGEKIYLTDFSRSEFYRLSKSFDWLKDSPSSIIDRLFYWTNGQPRMSCDLCTAANAKRISSPEEIDQLVKTMYLTAFDMAPIDSIREMVVKDTSLRDAVIQLSINKGETLPVDVKRKLYLAGIINWEIGAHDFKNPIMSSSLSYDWLLKIHDEELNFLSAAEKCIELSKEYRKAISFLNKYLESSKNNTDEDYVYYLLGLSYFRLEEYQESLKYLDLINKTSAKYNFGQLIKACNFIRLEKLADAKIILNYLINHSEMISRELYLRSVIALIDLYISDSSEIALREAKKTLLNTIHEYKEDIVNLDIAALSYYKLAVTNALLADQASCISSLDIALLVAKPTERPWLLFKKLLVVDSEQKHQVARELYDNLSEIKTKLNSENQENELELNSNNISEILANLMLDYPELDVIKMLRIFLVDSKENAVLIIYQVLEANENIRAKEFLNYICNLVSQEGWNFEIAQLALISHQLFLIGGDERFVHKTIELIKDHETILNYQSLFLLYELIIYYAKHKRLDDILYVADIFHSKEKSNNTQNLKFEIMIEYHECIALFRKGDLKNLTHRGACLLETIEKFNALPNKDEGGITKDVIMQIESDLSSWLKMAKATKDYLMPTPLKLQELSRNQKIRVRYILTGEEVVGKVKKLYRDINLGFCEIIRLE